MEREESRHDFAFMAGVVIGAIAGALATLALAPRTGNETRDRWRARIDEMPIEDLRSRASTLREAATSGTERIREAAASASAGDVVQSTRSRVTEMVDRSPLPITLSDESGDAEEELGDVASSAEEQLANAVGEANQAVEDTGDTISDTADDLDEHKPQT